MAQLVAGFATSHTPILALVADEWEARALNGRKNPQLWDTAELPPELLNSGSSEIRNWITVGGALGGSRNDFVEYYPVYRTPAGTGCGMAFAAWS